MTESGEERGDGRLQGDFLSEAMELVEALSSALLDAEGALKEGKEPGPDLVNEAFRATHTLKGISSLFGQPEVANLAHQLEDVLDRVRLGRTALDDAVLDVLFEGVDLLSRLVSGEPLPDLLQMEAFERRIVAFTSLPSAPLDVRSALERLQVNAEILSTLTEYEEHRLEESLRRGRKIYLVHGEFGIAGIDDELESLRTRLQGVGEVITTLPSEESAGEDRIGLDMMLATEVAEARLQNIVSEWGGEVRSLGAGPETATPVPASRTPVPGSPSTAGDVTEPGRARDGQRALSQTVRVNIDKLDYLMNTVGELSLVRNELHQIASSVEEAGAKPELSRDLARQMVTFSRRLDDLQRGILQVRMVPLSQLFDKLARVVRRLSREFEKQVSFYVSGGETEIDKLIVEELSDPLMHIIRNCIDHGVEDPISRAVGGKPAEGMVALRASARGNHVVVEVEDDGAGMDPDVLLRRAVERGFLTPEQAVEMTRREILNLIFLPGFTTREEVGQISGRGVGMDVVKTNLSHLSGLIEVMSEPGRGTRFSLTLPVTLAVVKALIVSVSEQIYAIPLSTVLEVVPLGRSQVSTIDGREVLTLRGTTLPLLQLEPLFGLAPQAMPADESRHRRYVVVVGMAQHRVGLVVNALAGQQDIVVKSLGKSLSGVPGIAGATELGGRRTVLVLDIAALVGEFAGS